MYNNDIATTKYEVNGSIRYLIVFYQQYSTRPFESHTQIYADFAEIIRMYFETVNPTVIDGRHENLSRP